MVKAKGSRLSRAVCLDPCLWRLLAKFGGSDKFILILRAFHEGMQARVMIDGEMTDAFPVAHGVKQGCVLAPTLFNLLVAVLEVSNRDTTKGVYITTCSEGRLFNVSCLKAKKKVRQLCVRDLLYADDTGFVSHSEADLQIYLTGLPPLLHLLDSLSMFEKLRSSINPLPGHRTQHRRSYSMLRHLTSLPPLNTLGAPSLTTAASTRNCRLEFRRTLPRSDDYSNDYGTNTTSSL